MDAILARVITGMVAEETSIDEEEFYLEIKDMSTSRLISRVTDFIPHFEDDVLTVLKNILGIR